MGEISVQAAALRYKSNDLGSASSKDLDPPSLIKSFWGALDVKQRALAFFMRTLKTDQTDCSLHGTQNPNSFICHAAACYLSDGLA